jgi:hypothetical protein
MHQTPLVSVIMPVYNAEAYVSAAVESILNQTFTDFEFIIVDDGSSDGTPAILDGFRDRRLVRLRHAQNQGYVYGLNEGLQLARGQLIARLDADDIALVERFAQQVDLLQQRPEVVLVGSAYHIIDEQGALLRSYCPLQEDPLIRWQMLFQNSFIHSAVMFRLAPIRQHKLCYDPDFMPAEDYALWSQLLRYGEGANLPTPLVKHRRHSQQISQTSAQRQKRNADRVARANLAALGYTCSDAELRILRDWQFKFPRPLSMKEMATFRMSLSILAKFVQQADIDDATARRLRRQWIQHITGHTSILRQWQALWRSGLLLAMLQEDATTTLVTLTTQTLGRMLRRTSSMQYGRSLQ